MEPLTARSTADPATALDQVGDFLRARPIENNLVLTLLGQRRAAPVDGRYWWVRRGEDAAGFVFQSPRSFRAVVSPAGVGAVDALVELIAEEAPDLPGVMGEATTAAAFAARWAERRRVPAVPTEGQRIYRLGTVRHPSGVPGRFRQASDPDRDVLVEWAQRFLHDTATGPERPSERGGGPERPSGSERGGGPERPSERGGGPFDPGEMTDRHLAGGRLWLWERDGRPVSMAAVSVPAAGVSRVAFVYTPVEHRSQGYAAACVAGLSEWVLAGGIRTCILYTQLSNPTSNALYRRIGYEPVTEVLIYRFG